MFFLTITLIPVTLYLLHFMTGISTKASLRRRLLDLYVLLGEVSDINQLAGALSQLKRTMKRSRKWFLIYYTAVTILCLGTTLPFILMSSREQLEAPLLKLSEAVIDQHFKLTFNAAISLNHPGFFYLDNGKTCVPRTSTWGFVDSKPGQKEKVATAIRSFSDAQLKEVVALSEILSDIFTFVTVGIAIVISMKVTLFLLSRLAGSRLWLLFSVALSFAIALLSPFVLIEMSTYSAATSIVAFEGGLPDFFSIGAPTVVNVAIAESTTLTLLLLNPESALAVVWHKVLPDSWAVAAIFDTIISVVTVPVSWGRLLPFFQDLMRFNSFDFDVSTVAGIRNWGVGTDMAFSLSYLLLAVLLVAAHRREPAREYMMKELQEIDSSTDGPLLSIAGKTKLLLGAALALLKKG